MRARRQAWRIALAGAAAVAPTTGALAAPPEPAKPSSEPPKPSPEPAKPPQAVPEATKGAAGPTKPPRPRKFRPYVERGNAIPAPYALATLGLGANVRIGLPPQDELNLGFGVGLGSRVWLDGAIGTLRIAPSVVFHSAQIGPNLLILDTPRFELDATVHVAGPSDDGRPIEQVEPGIFGVVHAGALRIDAGLYGDVNPGPTTTFGFRLPASLSFQFSQHVHAIVTTGIGTGSFAAARESTAIPLGVTLGWSDYLGTTGPQAVGIFPSISFPELVKPWANEVFRPGYFSVGITFFYVWKF